METLSIKSSLEKYNSQHKNSNSVGNNNNGKNVNNNNNNLKNSNEYNNKIKESDIIADYQPKIISRGFNINDMNNNNKNLVNNVNKNNSINNNNNNDDDDKDNNKEKKKNKEEFQSFSLDKNEAKNILSNQIELREKEIKRQTKLAEKDKKDSLFYVNHIKEYRELLNSYIKDFYEDLDNDELLLLSPTTSPTTSPNSRGGGDSASSINTAVEKGSPLDIQQRKSHIIEKSAALSAIEGTIQSPFQTFSPLSFIDNQNVHQHDSIISSPATMTSSSSTLLPNTIATTSSSTTTPMNDLLNIGRSPPLSSLSFWDSPVQKSNTPINNNINNDNNNNNNSVVSPILMEHDQQSTQHPPHEQKQQQQEKETVSNLVTSYQSKDVELERVVNRAKAESIRFKYLKSKFEELSQLVQSEKEYWNSIVEKRRKEVDYKEREINRLLMVAETQKKKLMDCTDQITKLKKSLNSISQIRENSTIVDIKKINERFSFESLSNSPIPSSSHGSSTSSSSLTNGNHTSGQQHHHHHHHGNGQIYSSSHSGYYNQRLSNDTIGNVNSVPISRSISPNKLYSSNGSNYQQSPKSLNNNQIHHQNQPKFYTEEKRDLYNLVQQSEKKDEEIRRIKDIIEYDTFKTVFFSNKVNELKLILEEESRQVDSLQNQSLLEIKEKDDAIFKVALRAQKERLKSNRLKDEIRKITKVLSESNLNNKSTSNNNNNNNNNNKNNNNNNNNVGNSSNIAGTSTASNSGSKSSNRKSPELDPVFMEMGDLKQFQDLSLNQYCDENILSNYILGRTPPSSGPQHGHARRNSQQHYTYQTHHLNPCLSPRLYIPQQQLSPQQQSSIPPIVRSNSVTSSINIPSSVRRSFSQDNINNNGQPQQQQQINSNGNGNGTPTNIHNGLSKSPRYYSSSAFSPQGFNGNQQQVHYVGSYGSSSAGMLGNSMGSSNGGNHFLVGSPSEMIMHKLKEIERLNKEAIQKDQELNQVKKIAEAERSRLCLLKDKFKELRNELLEKDSSQHQYNTNYCTKTY